MINILIYKITNKINSKVYIGQTSESIKKRFARHFSSSKTVDTKFYRAIRKYGIVNFSIEPIDSATTQKELDEKEVFWINFYNAVADGYNSHSNIGKCGGDTLSNHPNLDLIKQKISITKQGSKNPNSKRIKAINMLNNKEIIYDCFISCQRDLGIPRHDIIGRRCRGIIKKPYNDEWLFEYID